VMIYTNEPHQKQDVMIYTNPTKNWVWWYTRTPPKTGCDDLHEPHQKLVWLSTRTPLKTGRDDLHQHHQKLGVMIYTNPTKN
jgi:lipocalin